MTGPTCVDDDRAVSEAAGVAILLVFTLAITASVGVSVLFVDEEAGGEPRANFTYDYIDDASVLLVTHDRGDPIAAGNLTIRGPNGANATWAALAGTENGSELVEPGDTVQLSGNNAYGDSVSRGDTIRVYYAPPGGNETLLSTREGR